MRKVEVVPYNEQWSKIFQDECKKIKNVFGGEIIDIHHVGSTAVPNIHAKPVIDIIVEVKSMNNIDYFNNEMEEIDYAVMGEYGMRDRRFFIKGGDNRTHHVHIFEKGNEEIARHLAFRDYMIAHPEDAQEYSQLKQRLAKMYPTDIENYIKGKNNFIREMDERAKEWKNK